MTIGAGRPKKCTYSIDEEGHQYYECIYDVPVTDPDDSINDVSAASGVPLFGDTFSFGNATNPDAFCIGKQTSHIHEDGTNLWRQVTARFSTKDTGRARSGNNVRANPLNEKWKISGSFVNGTRVTNLDKNDNAVTTSGKEAKYFDVPDGYDTLNLEGPSATISLSTRAQAIRKVNSATIWGLTTRQLFMAQWQYQVLYHGNVSYVYNRMEFHINYLKWNEFWIDQGTQEYIAGNPVGKQIVPIVAKNDSLGNNIRFLDGSGRILAESSIPAGVIINEDEIIKEFDFTTLGFPDPLPGPFV